jgi:hypothetical protein
MKSVIRWTSLAVIVITIGLTIGAVIIASRIEIHPVSAAQLAIYRFDLDIFKTIVAGFLVAMLGILIPAYITEARQNFERLKESRAAYSNAKTGLDYLALRLCTAKLAKAPDIIQEVHFHKHQAVLFPEFRQHIKDRYESCISADKWDEVAYKKLRNTRLLLKKHASGWDNLTAPERLEILKAALPDVDEVEHPCHLLDYPRKLDGLDE